jgi:AcrR family transcriptional regulator
VKGLLTKNKVIDAAITLFNVQGYDGTSVRNIAKEADVNIALISYYFGGKKGLLEHLISMFFEGYLQKMSEIIEKQSNLTAKQCLKDVVLQLLTYQEDNKQLARFVHREMTIDTMLVREVMTTYLMKEKYLFQQLLERGVQTGEFNISSIDYTVLHMRNLTIMPYLHPQYIRENYYIVLEENSFKQSYYTYVCDIIEDYLCKK